MTALLNVPIERSNDKRDSVADFTEGDRPQHGTYADEKPVRSDDESDSVGEMPDQVLEVREKPRILLDTFNGFVREVDEDIAYLTLQTSEGEEFVGEYSAAALAAIGIFEHSRFTCCTYDVAGMVDIEFTPSVDDQSTLDEEVAEGHEIDNLLTGSIFDDNE